MTPEQHAQRVEQVRNAATAIVNTSDALHVSHQVFIEALLVAIQAAAHAHPCCTAQCAFALRLVADRMDGTAGMHQAPLPGTPIH